MDPRKLMSPPEKTARIYSGDRWSLRRLLYTMNWTSCLIGLVFGVGLTAVMALALMLIITPYIHQGKGTSSLRGNDIWSSYGKWKWSPCPVSCGHGIQQGQRSRSCLSATYCIGNETETIKRPCNSIPCRVDGQWSDWITHSPCSVSCGTGTETLYRECSNPFPKNGGKTCQGERIKQTKCFKPDCCPGKIYSNKLQCEGGWMRNDNFSSCYCFSNNRASWYIARNYCRTRSAILTTIYSLKESEWLREQSKQLLGGDIWIGGKIVSYSEMWILPTGNKVMNFTQWAPNEPKHHAQMGYECVQLWAAQNYLWDDYLCSHKQHFICKSTI